MPSIEIVCVNQKSPSYFRGIPFAIVSESGEPRSHRHPSHFQRDFDKLQGCIYHLGCPHLRRSRTKRFEAYELLSGKCREQERLIFLEFGKEFVPSIKKMLNTLLLHSPVGRVIFTIDYKFSPNRPKRIRRISAREFWALHRRKQLRFNALYTIISDTAARSTRMQRG
jgi:hypothetical protein